MVETKEWSKYDPKDAVIAALTNKVHHLQGVRYRGRGVNTTNTTTTNPSGQGGRGYEPGCHGLSKCRIVKGEENIYRDVKTYWWCPHHKQDYLYDGVYMEHDPGYGHKVCKANLDKKKAHRKKETSATSSTPTNSSEGFFDIHQLKLSENFRLRWRLT